MQEDAVCVGHLPVDLLHESADVVSAAARVRLDEVGVLRRHLRCADAESLRPGQVDEAAGGVAGRVGEHGACVRASGLVLPPPPDDLGQESLPVPDIVDLELESGCSHDLCR